MKKVTDKMRTILLLFCAILFFGCTEDEISNIPAQQVTINSTEVTLDPGEKIQLTATVTPDNAGNSAVFWKSNNERIAVADNGVIIALSPGTTTIAAIAYSNADAYAEVTVTVTGVPEDLAAAIAGTYVGDVTMGGMPLATQVEAFLTAADNKMRLATEAATGMGTLSMDIEIDVQNNGGEYRITGAGISSFGTVSVAGTIDAEGNMTLTINLPDAGVEVVFTAKKGQTSVEAVTGIYSGSVSIPMMGSLPDIELTLSMNDNRVKLATTVDVPTVGVLIMDIPVNVTRDGENYAIAGGGESTFGPVSISGTVSATGEINLIIHVTAYDMDVTYKGQKQ
ncbi:MAG: Ig-like domain-containing protein [Dysgonamonadaceae bacterium]|jgi:hypothetical protein|nr:Ig-like domain-containing protein [Dysgonamonadaceae bacterium]